MTPATGAWRSPALLGLAAACLIGGCSTAPQREPDQPAAATGSAKPAPQAAAPRRGGGYYLDDGPGDNPPLDLDRIPDAEPRVEALHRAANNPYVVFGREYVPERSVRPFRQRGIGSWYGRKFHGQRTSIGEIYDMYAMTAAHPTLPLPSYARVTNIANGRSVVVRVNDRGPFLHGRVIDLSYAAANRLGYVEQGSALVEVETIVPGATLVAGAVPSVPREPAVPAEPVAAREDVARVPVEREPAGIYLQLGAFSARDNAESLRARLTLELALDQPIEVYAKDGLFRLHVGPYRSRAEATAAAEQIRAAAAFRPHVVVR